MQTAARSTISWFDGHAREYDARHSRLRDRLADRANARIVAPHVNGRMVLDAGCGTGLLLDRHRPGGYVGVDASNAMLDECERKHPGVELVCCDVAELLLNVRSGFDTVVALWAYPYFDDPKAFLWDALGIAEVVVYQWWEYGHRAVDPVRWRGSSEAQEARRAPPGVRLRHHRPWPRADTRITVMSRA
jgi:SAM-dependent methyltransferase